MGPQWWLNLTPTDNPHPSGFKIQPSYGNNARLPSTSNPFRPYERERERLMQHCDRRYTITIEPRGSKSGHYFIPLSPIVPLDLFRIDWPRTCRVSPRYHSPSWKVTVLPYHCASVSRIKRSISHHCRIIWVTLCMWGAKKGAVGFGPPAKAISMPSFSTFMVKANHKYRLITHTPSNFPLSLRPDIAHAIQPSQVHSPLSSLA